MRPWQWYALLTLGLIGMLGCGTQSRVPTEAEMRQALDQSDFNTEFEFAIEYVEVCPLDAAETDRISDRVFILYYEKRPGQVTTGNPRF